jgi:hypothetical protein
VYCKFGPKHGIKQRDKTMAGGGQMQKDTDEANHNNEPLALFIESSRRELPGANVSSEWTRD